MGADEVQVNQSRHKKRMGKADSDSIARTVPTPLVVDGGRDGDYQRKRLGCM